MHRRELDITEQLNWTDVCHSLSSKKQASFTSIAIVIIYSDFGVHKTKVCHCFHCFPIYPLWSDETRCSDNSSLNVELWATISLSSFPFIKRPFSSSWLSAICMVSSHIWSCWYISQNGFPCPPPRNLSGSGIKPAYLKSHVLASGFFTTSTTWKAYITAMEPSFYNFCMLGVRTDKLLINYIGLTTTLMVWATELDRFCLAIYIILPMFLYSYFLWIFLWFLYFNKYISHLRILWNACYNSVYLRGTDIYVFSCFCIFFSYRL